MQPVTFRILFMSLIVALCACATPPPAQPTTPAKGAATPATVDLTQQDPADSAGSPTPEKGGRDGQGDETVGADRGVEGGVEGAGADRFDGMTEEEVKRLAPAGGVMGGAQAGAPAAAPRGGLGGSAAPSPGPVMRGPAPSAAIAGANDPNKKAGNPLTVTAADPSIGKKTALVTIVEFADFECPFCMRAAATMADLRKIYGPDKLRFVWKNNPLSFHHSARPAAEAAMALFESGGDAWFWSFYENVFSSTAPTMKDAIDGALKRTPMPQADMQRVLLRGNAARKVDADIELGKRVGVTGTPAFFINGVFLSGAQSIEKFRAIIDQELAKAKELLASGVPAAHLYDVTAVKNLANRPPPAPRSAPAAQDDKTVWVVPVGASPVRGKPTALVTLVVFSDFQCPFCARAETTVSALERDYADKLRIVFKHNPLPFHPRAEPAAELAIETRAQKGDAGFWKVHDLLWQSARATKLTDQDLEGIAQAAGLRAQAAMQAVTTQKHKGIITADQDLADDLQASGTPHFFINGRRLVGAQPIETFKAMIDEEIAKAEALVAKGTPPAKVYEAIQKNGKTPPPPERKTVPAAGKDSPSRGPGNAKVTIQVFSDFQCPFCKRVEDTIAAVMKAYPTQVRLVWRNKPLPMHKQAALAAEASLEAFRQKGDAGFWKMHELLFQDQSPAGLERAALERHAAAAGLDVTKFAAALDSGAHAAAVERDSKIADAAGISGTPAFVINGYFISGAQPFSKFKKLIDRALKEAK